jgi:hypothetical protein
MNKIVTLGNAVEMNAKYPDTFEVPSADTISEVSLGEDVKLCFKYDGDNLLPNRNEAGIQCDSERMWVTVIKKDGNNWVGTIDNDPVSPLLKYGEEVHFHTSNIYATQ